MSHEFTVDAGLVVFSRDGRAQFGWLDLVTGAFYAEPTVCALRMRSARSNSTRT